MRLAQFATQIHVHIKNVSLSVIIIAGACLDKQILILLESLDVLAIYVELDIRKLVRKSEQTICKHNPDVLEGMHRMPLVII